MQVECGDGGKDFKLAFPEEASDLPASTSQAGQRERVEGRESETTARSGVEGREKATKCTTVTAAATRDMPPPEGHLACARSTATGDLSGPGAEPISPAPPVVGGVDGEAAAAKPCVCTVCLSGGAQVTGGDDGDGSSDSVSPGSTTAATRGSNVSERVGGIANGEGVCFSRAEEALELRKGEAHRDGVPPAFFDDKPRFDVESATEATEYDSCISGPPTGYVGGLATVVPELRLAVTGQVSQVEGVHKAAAPVGRLVPVRIRLPDC